MPASDRVQQPQEAEMILRVGEDRLPPVPSCADVVDPAGDPVSRRSGHWFQA
jgi:hypothetical protein